MKTLIDKTDKSAKYLFINGTSTREVEYKKNDNSIEEVDFEKISDKEYAMWLSWLGE